MRVVSLSFTQGFTEDYSPGNIPWGNCSRGREKASIYIWIWFFWLRYTCSPVYILVKDYCSSQRRDLKLMILVFFYEWENARIWCHWNSSWAMHFNYLGTGFVQNTGCLILLSPSWILSTSVCSGLIFNPLYKWIRNNILCFFFFV